MIPLVLLLPVNTAVASILFLSYAGMKFGWLLNARELAELNEAVQGIRQKLAGLINRKQQPSV